MRPDVALALALTLTACSTPSAASGPDSPPGSTAVAPPVAPDVSFETLRFPVMGTLITVVAPQGDVARAVMRAIA